MQITIQQLTRSTEALNKLAVADADAALKFRIARVLKQVIEEQSTATQQHKALLDKYGTLQADGSYVFLTADARKGFDEEYAGLYQQEVEIRFDKFTPESVGKFLSAIDIVNLEWLLTTLDAPETDALPKA